MFWLILIVSMYLAWKLPLRRLGLMCDPTLAVMAIAGGVSAYSQYQQGKSQNQYYQYLAGQSRLQGDAENARAQKQAELTQENASIQNKNLAIRSAELGASQRASMAAMGVDPSSVSAQDITLDTLTKEKMDEMMIRRNANLQAWSQSEQGKYDKWTADAQATNYGYAGKMAKKAGQINAMTTLLGTAVSMGTSGLLTSNTTSPLTSGVKAYGGGVGTGSTLNYSPSSLQNWTYKARLK